MYASRNSLLLKVSRLQQQLSRLHEYIIKDEMTGIYNRYFLMQWIKQHQADTSSLIIVYIDIDYLKPINDQYGHATGDEMLCHVADLLQQCCRKSDYAIRMSGDEFLLLLPDVPSNKIASVTKRLQAKLESLSLAGFSFGIDYGLARDIQKIIILADQRMYAQKNRKYSIDANTLFDATRKLAKTNFLSTYT